MRVPQNDFFITPRHSLSCFLKRPLLRTACAALCFATLSFAMPSSIYAAGDNPALRGLAKDFLKSVNTGFSKADHELAKQGYAVSSLPENSDVSQTENQPETTIPDGEELILRILVGEDKIPLELDVIAVKQSQDILISLSDFFYTVDFPIRVDADGGTASGWYIREHQEFFLDTAAETITLSGETTPIDSAQVVVRDGDIFATSYALSQWFDMNFIVDYTELAVLLKTSQPIPAEERYARRQKRLSRTVNTNQPNLPVEEQPYRKATVPALDVNLRSSYSNFQGKNPQLRQTWSVIGTNDLAKHSLQTYASGDDDDKLNTMRMTLSRKSDDPTLLGPLKAREYNIGDVYTTRLPLTGGSAQEQGVRVTNLSDGQLLNLSTTNIRGDAQPGWDVELYRNDRLVSFQEITDDGTYNFDNISLFAGANDFRLIFYGPQGEIVEERKSIPVSKNQISSGEHYYDVSISRSNEITFREDPFGEPEDGAPHVVARYDRGIGNDSSIHAGIRHRQEENTDKTYLETGLATYVKGTFINTTLAVDAENGGTAAEVTGRRSFGLHSLLGSLRLNTSTFDPGNESTDPLIAQTNFSARGPFRKLFGYRTTYGFDTEYLQRDSGFKDFDLTGSLSTRIGNVIVNNALSYDYQTDSTGDTNSFVTGNLNMRGFMRKARWRVLSNYEIAPEQELRELIASITYPFTRRLEGFFEFEHELTPRRTEAVASMNWKTDHATITPRLSMDTDSTVQASVNVQFGVGYNPENHDFEMINKRISNSGSATAHVFLDKDGDGVFGADDKKLPDVTFDAAQVHREAKTDKGGVAFIPNLPEGIATDLILDSSSFEDPYWISSYPGMAVKPRAGVTTQLEFPLVVSGEIDGTIYRQTTTGSTRQILRQFPLYLMSPNGTVVQKTNSAYDGFYIFSNVPPGSYFLVADTKSAAKYDLTAPLPRRIDILPDGTVHYGVDVTLTAGAQIDYLFSATPPKTHPKAIPPTPSTQTSGLILGQYTSRLAMTLSWYKMKMKYRDIAHYFEPTTPLSDITPDPKTQMYMLRLKMKNAPVLNTDAAYMTCEKLSKIGFPCTVEITSHYKEKIAHAANLSAVP